jgi:hypothetical protein
MKIAFGALVALLSLQCQVAYGDVHCYDFRNDSGAVATLAFSYRPAIGNVITGAALEPGKSYPFDGRPWCWNLPEGTTATVAVSGAAAPEWKGTLVLGNGPNTAPSGTYVLGGIKATAAAPAVASAAAAAVAPATAAAAVGAATAAGVATAASAPSARAAVAPAAATTAAQGANCLANTYPDNGGYCLTALENDVRIQCGVGHTGVSGNIVVSHLTVKCHSGKSLKLSCRTVTGGRQKCDLNDHEICTDENVRNAAEYCGR